MKEFQQRSYKKDSQPTRKKRQRHKKKFQIRIINAMVQIFVYFHSSHTVNLLPKVMV